MTDPDTFAHRAYLHDVERQLRPRRRPLFRTAKPRADLVRPILAVAAVCVGLVSGVALFA